MTQQHNGSSTPQHIGRREVLLGAGGAALALAAGGSLARDGHNHAHTALPGYDKAKGEYVLPPLPYAPEALEPHIDAQTMTIHHGRHHAGYVRGLNTALRKLAEIRNGTGDATTIEHWSRELNFNAGGHVNHALFWAGMAPANAGGGGQPEGDLLAAIERDFGSYAKFAAHFRAASASVEGSGWGWLVYEPVAGRLLITQMHNQQLGLFTGVVPLLGVDVWEHAYYLRYQNRRGDYIDAFMSVVNWSEIASRFAAATA